MIVDVIRFLFSLQVTVSTQDKRSNKLIFKVHLLEMNQKVLLDFRLSKVCASVNVFLSFCVCCVCLSPFSSLPVSRGHQGDGLEFKRLFLKIKQGLSDIVSAQKIPLPIT